MNLYVNVLSKLTAPEAKTLFDMSDFKFHEVKVFIGRARSKFVSGPGNILYMQALPKTAQTLEETPPFSFSKEEGTTMLDPGRRLFVPKEDKSRELHQIREISLLEVEGNIFWAIVSKRITHYLIANKFLGPSIQKGVVSGFSGCLEHTAALSKEAERHKETLSLMWLDLVKAYPSVPHQLRKRALPTL